ncbi:MAG TPA: phage BR0599 family protein [Phycisphaerae bacterium]|nr:phage BR0599 family protein [Phycisphaerae bacterium]
MKDALPAFEVGITSTERRMIDLLKITLTGAAEALRFVNWDAPITIAVGDDAEATFLPLPFIRGDARFQADLQIDEITLTVPNGEVTLYQEGAATPTASTVAGLAVSGVFDGAGVSLYQLDLERQVVFHHSDWVVSLIAAITRVSVTVHLQSWISKLDMRAPQTICQEQCNNALFDNYCGLLEGPWQILGTALGGDRDLMFSDRAEANGWFDLGMVEFLTGSNAGQSKTVSRFEAGTFYFPSPFQCVVASGDTYRAVPGCNKTVDECLTKFANLTRYRGFPYIPRPEIMVG